jgi:glycosyltransferase involved in cell wall biosynthesis
VSKEYPPVGENYGAARLYHHIATYLVTKGHEVHVVTQAFDRNSISTDRGVFVHRIAASPWSFHRGSALGRIRFQILCGIYLLRLCKKKQIDVVDTQFFFAESFPFCLFRRCPVVIRYNASSAIHLKVEKVTKVLPTLQLLLAHIFEVVASYFSSIIVVNSEQSRSELLASKWLRPLRRKVVKVYETGRDLSSFLSTSPVNIADIRSALSLPIDSKIVLWVNRFTIRKGIYQILDALRIVTRQERNLLFVAIGEEENARHGTRLSDAIKKFCHENGIKNILPGYVKRDLLLKYYQACDVVVHPSLHETFGWVPLEALCLGKPVVATKTGVWKEFDSTPEGLVIIEPGDVRALASSILVLFNREAYLPENRAFAIKFLEKLDVFRETEYIYIAMKHVKVHGSRRNVHNLSFML